MSKEIINNIETLEAFYTILRENTGIVIIKFGADWCAPCRKIEGYVEKWFNNVLEVETRNIQPIYVNVDDCFELYAHLKTKKMVQGIPAILAYRKGNTSYIFDDCVTGTDENAIDAFFGRCINMALNL